MEILSFLILPILITLFLVHISLQPPASGNIVNVDDFQEQIEQALSLPPSSQESLQKEPASAQLMGELENRGIYLQRSLTKEQAMNVLGLFSPPNGRQVDILKHFNIPYSNIMNQTMARYLILELFSDPNKVEQWRDRTPTGTERQNLPFMEGKLAGRLTRAQVLARLKQLCMGQADETLSGAQADRASLPEEQQPPYQDKKPGEQDHLAAILQKLRRPQGSHHLARDRVWRERHRVLPTTGGLQHPGTCGDS